DQQKCKTMQRQGAQDAGARIHKLAMLAAKGRDLLPHIMDKSGNHDGRAYSILTQEHRRVAAERGSNDARNELRDWVTKG
ncbi:MAG TPA: hypothetical protein VG867_08775, partial [Rhizomicrobium sp.]|nr:hypothetical protein [Rhizomicrobium sp.]